MPIEWCTMSDELQLAMSRQAMRQAALLIANQAELFAVQFEGGTLADRGAADALHLFATLLRETTASHLMAPGHA